MKNIFINIPSIFHWQLIPSYEMLIVVEKKEKRHTIKWLVFELSFFLNINQ